ncbi:unnamed protein product [Caenorhabditis sp. 36 PRJEB53466]|nr:unnamed protein product [Caenorhabditis sp. 36 PRJEB53466]
MEAKKTKTGEKESATKVTQTIEKKVKRKRAQRALLVPETKIRSRTKRTWCVIAHIGSGGFGDVYKVCDEAKPSYECAMKTEIHNADQRRLSLERSILREIDGYTKAHKKERHFCELIDAGSTNEFSWIAMTLIGPSLEDVRRMLGKQYSRPCVVNMALQILEAVEVMHEVGFIHRDLKPSNICTGVAPADENVLYVLDFGISRRIFKNNKSKELRNKRERVPFFGTKKFCSLACHLEKDQGRKDDMETYLYTILNLYHTEKGLPWSRDMAEPKKIVEKKKALFANPQKELDAMIPAVFAKMVAYLAGLKFHDPVDYRMLEADLQSLRKEREKDKNCESSDEKLMDWTGRLEALLKETKKNPKKTEQPKGEETLMFERLQKARHGREMQSAGAMSTVNESCMKTMTREGEPSEAGPATSREPEVQPKRKKKSKVKL